MNSIEENTINIVKHPSTDAMKRAKQEYYNKNKEMFRQKQKELYDRIKDTHDFKQRKQLYNQLYLNKQKTDTPKKPTGRPRKYIISTVEPNPNPEERVTVLSDTLKQFPIEETTKS